VTTPHRRQIEATVVRLAILAFASLGVTSAIAGLFHGVEVHADDGTLLEMRAIGGAGYLAFVAVLGVPLAFVWRHPRATALFVWSVAVWIVGVIVIAATFKLEFDHPHTYVERWPYHLFTWTTTPLAWAVLAVTPPVTLVYALADAILTRRANRRPPAVELPSARVVR
jgi:hypothetical protein